MPSLNSVSESNLDIQEVSLDAKRELSTSGAPSSVDSELDRPGPNNSDSNNSDSNNSDSRNREFSNSESNNSESNNSDSNNSDLGITHLRNGSSVANEPKPRSTSTKPTPTRSKKPSTKTQTHKWSRIVHVYTSMISLVLVAFFSLTGITLNHPEWTIGSPSREVVKGTLPQAWKPGDTVDWLVTAESLRAKHSLRGAVDNHTESETSDSISFKAPGYAADAFIDPSNGSYELTIDQPGLLGTLNDLHKGRDANNSWKWLIDVIGVLLVVISLTGLLLQLFLRKRRRSALTSALTGTALSLVFAISHSAESLVATNSAALQLGGTPMVQVAR